MVPKNTIVRILIALIFTCSLTSIAAATENNSYFEELKNDPNFIASKGKFPETIDQEWNNSVNECWLNITTKTYHSDFHPSIISLSSAGSFLIVELDPGFEDEIDGSTIDEIYQKISRYCDQEGVNEVSVIFMWPYDAPLPLPDYGPDILEAARKDPRFIASRGMMPVITEEGEKRAWLDLLHEGARGRRLADRYFKSSGGPMIAFGLSINGYLFVEFDSETPEKVNESLINEIYHVIDVSCTQAGINEVPVVFMWGEEAVECLGVESSAPDQHLATLMADYVEYGNYTLIDKGNTRQSPAFTSLVLILNLLLVAKRKKK